MDLPFVDLAAQYRTIESELDSALLGAMREGDHILGSEVAAFEAEFASYCGAKFAVGVGSGTDALHLSCRALGLEAGDEVIVPAFTFIASALGIVLSGATPVAVDAEPSTGLLDLEACEAAITPRTRAIVPVHLYGQSVDMGDLVALARKHDLYVIEDAAQAHGAVCNGHRVGSLGHLGCFSFYPSKNLGAVGDGGMVTTSDAKLAGRLRMLRNWGSDRKYVHQEFGINSRLDNIQAAVLRVKLRYLDAWNAKRVALARLYHQALADIDALRLTEYDAGSVYHLYVVRCAGRDRVLHKLRQMGVGAGIHYPYALHEHHALRGILGGGDSFPVSEQWARSCLSLPMYAELPQEGIEYVAKQLGRAVAEAAAQER